MQGGDGHYPRCSEAAKAAGGDLIPSVPAPRAPVWDEAWANSASCHTQPPHNALPLTQQRGRGGSRTPPEPTTTRQGFSAAPPEAGPAGGEAGAGLRARLPGLQPPGCHGYGPPPPLPAARSNRPQFKPPRRIPRMRAAARALPSAWRLWACAVAPPGLRAPRAVGGRGGREGAEGGMMAAGASGRTRASRQLPAALPQPPAAGGAGTGGPPVAAVGWARLEGEWGLGEKEIWKEGRKAQGKNEK